MARPVPMEVIARAAKIKAARDNLSHEAATQAIIQTLPAMGREVDHNEARAQSANLDFAGANGFDPNKTQPIFNPLLSSDEY